jgi:hypothetical protein
MTKLWHCNFLSCEGFDPKLVIFSHWYVNVIAILVVLQNFQVRTWNGAVGWQAQK